MFLKNKKIKVKMIFHTKLYAKFKLKDAKNTITSRQFLIKAKSKLCNINLQIFL